MTELMTLKDLETSNVEDYTSVVLIKDLREEAINWIKHFESLKTIIGYKDCIPEVIWIKNFFNITDEELEGKK